MNINRVVLAFDGHPASCAAVRWLMERHGADVVALVVDVGQMDDLEEVQTRAVACGAVRAHVVDRCDAFARGAVVSAMQASVPPGPHVLKRLADPVVAAALVEVAAIEGAVTVAHASVGDALAAHICRLKPSLRVVAPAREWESQNVSVADYVKMHHLSPGVARPERHLLIRRPLNTASGCEAASVTIGFEDGVPSSVNGVSLDLPELIESLSLIGSRYGLSEEDPIPAPALGLLRAAYSAGLSAVAGAQFEVTAKAEGSAKADGSGSVDLLVRCGSIAVAGTWTPSTPVTKS